MDQLGSGGMTATQLRRICQGFFEDQGIRYEVQNAEQNRLVVRFAPDKEKDGGGFSTAIAIEFDEVIEGETVHTLQLQNWSYITCRADDYFRVLEAINTSHTNYRWVKAFLLANEDGTYEIDATADAYVLPESVGPICAKYIYVFSNVFENLLVSVRDYIEIH